LQNLGLACTIVKPTKGKHAKYKTEATMKSLVYVGMDVHKDTIAIAVFKDNDSKVMFERTIKNYPKTVKDFFGGLIQKGFDIITCYVAGPAGFTIYRQLEDLDITCYVIAPSLLPMKPGDHIKTDRRDALKLARCLRNQEGTPIYIPSIDDEAVRDYLRMVCDFKEDLRRNKQRFVHFLNRLGKKYDEGDYWTIKHRSWLKKLKLDQNIHQEVFNEYFTAVEESEDRKDD
jgi:transposase